MKVVVLGGGIAGLCMGIYLLRNGVEVVVNERQVFAAAGGHAFLMHHDGYTILEELIADAECDIPGKTIDGFVFKDFRGDVKVEKALYDWHCFKRTDLLNCLIGLFPESQLRNQRVFSHFIYEQERIVAAAFKNGEIETGDIFIGADGAHSGVRQQIFGEVKFEPGIVKELVGIAEHPALALSLKGKFTKYQDQQRGLSFGVIPTTDREVVWFMQYHPELGDVPTGTEARAHEKYPEQMRDLCLTLLKDFPAEVQAVLMANDFTTSYVWQTQDFDLLPSFAKDNVVLIGDAAHVALPFTSAGTTNAMLDAKILTECLLLYPDAELAFREYYRIRSEAVNHHVKLGRDLRDAFLNKSSVFSLPLIDDKMKPQH